jgi:hypothetical protein
MALGGCSTEHSEQESEPAREAPPLLSRNAGPQQIARDVASRFVGVEVVVAAGNTIPAAAAERFAAALTSCGNRGIRHD